MIKLDHLYEGHGCFNCDHVLTCNPTDGLCDFYDQITSEPQLIIMASDEITKALDIVAMEKAKELANA